MSLLAHTDKYQVNLVGDNQQIKQFVKTSKTWILLNNQTACLLLDLEVKLKKTVS